jgi:hypothetical protein
MGGFARGFRQEGAVAVNLKLDRCTYTLKIIVGTGRDQPLRDNFIYLNVMYLVLAADWSA